jgi:hypothetical protein
MARDKEVTPAVELLWYSVGDFHMRTISGLSLKIILRFFAFA